MVRMRKHGCSWNHVASNNLFATRVRESGDWTIAQTTVCTHVKRLHVPNDCTCRTLARAERLQSHVPICLNGLARPTHPLATTHSSAAHSRPGRARATPSSAHCLIREGRHRRERCLLLPHAFHRADVDCASRLSRELLRGIRA